MRKEMPADPVDLRHRQQAPERPAEHAPELRLERLRARRLEHLVLAHDPIERQHLPDVLSLPRRLELRASDVGEHHAIGPRKDEATLVGRSRRINQRLIPLEHVLHRLRVLASVMEPAFC